MPIITGGQVIEGGMRLTNAGSPVAGTDAVQTLTIGGTPTGGTFRLTFEGFTTAAITWSSTNNTLRDNVDAALEALPNIGTAGVATAVGSMASGVGTLTITFDGTNTAKRVQSTITVANNSMTGTEPTVAVEETTPGVRATGLGAPIGSLLTDITNGVVYVNEGTPDAPDWAAVTTA